MLSQQAVAKIIYVNVSFSKANSNVSRPTTKRIRGRGARGANSLPPHPSSNLALLKFTELLLYLVYYIF